MLNVLCLNEINSGGYHSTKQWVKCLEVSKLESPNGQMNRKKIWSS